MHPPDLEKFIYPTNSRQEWFLESWNSSLSLQWGLNTGITNVFEFQGAKTNCTDATVVFGGGGEPKLADWTLSRDGTRESLLHLRYTAPYNFWNCAFFPNLTKDIRDLSLSSDKREFFLDQGMDLSPVTSETVTTLLSTCLNAYCDTSTQCRTSLCALPNLVLNGSTLSASMVDQCLDSICYYEPERSSDPDIAGIGVVSSYIVQFVISVIALLTLTICVWRLRTALQDTQFQSIKIIKKVAQLQAAIETLLITMDDFQRAQCCFGLAMDIASMITLQKEATSITKQDRKAIALVSTIGTAPTVIVLTMLMALNERRSSLTFWVTFITWVSSVAVGLHPKTLLSSTKYIEPSVSYPEVCGGLSPAQVCGYDQGSGAIFTLSMHIHLISMSFLTAWHVWPTVVGVIQTFRPQLSYRSPPKISTGLSTAATKTPSSQIHVIWFFVIGVIIIANIVASIAVLTDYVHGALSRGDVNSEWTFGQVVAFTIWLPSLLSFVNDLVYGPLRGRTQQLPDTLKLVRLPLVRNDHLAEKMDEGIDLSSFDC